MAFFGLLKPNIAKLKARRDVDKLIDALACNDLDVRMGAADALGELGDARAVEPLCASLNDNYSSVGAAAARALSKIGDARAVVPLCTVLQGDGWHAKEAARALGQIGDARAVAPLCAALQGQYRGGCEAEAAEALGKIGDARAVGPLCAALQGDGRVAAEAARALGQISDAQAVEPLCAALQGNFKVVADVLVKIDDKRAVEAFCAMLRDPHWNKESAQMLDRLGWQPDSSPNGVAYWYVKENWQKCVEIGAPAVAPMHDIMRRVYRPPEAYSALAAIGGKQAAEVIIDVSPYELSPEASSALIRLGADAVEPLCAVLQRETADGRFEIHVVEALGRLGDVRAVKLLTDVAVSRYRLYGPTFSFRARDTAAAALVSFGLSAVEPLCAVLTSGDRKARRVAASILDSLKWQPDQSMAAGAYWAVKRNWQKCVEVGEPAQKPLLAVISEAPRTREYIYSYVDGSSSLSNADDHFQRLEDRDSAEAALYRIRMTLSTVHSL